MPRLSPALRPDFRRRRSRVRGRRRTWSRRHARRRREAAPHFLHGLRQAIGILYECDDGPDIVVAERLAPGGHAGPADTGLGHPEELPVRIAGNTADDLGNIRIEGTGHGAYMSPVGTA